MSQAVLVPPAVSRAINILLRQPIHPTFAGYLCVKREAVRMERTENLRPDFVEFHDTFLSIPGGPAGRPYYRPFWDEDRSESKAWYQRNVAGTYSPASASRIAAFAAVIDIDGRNYSLRPKHWELAKRYLLFGNEVPVVPLAVFLYRDFGLDIHPSSAIRELISIFREEFGYSEESEFRHIYKLEQMNDADPVTYFQFNS